MNKYDSPKNIVPKLEDVRPGSIWAFTIAPETQYLHPVPDVERLEKMRRWLKNRLAISSISYKIYIELSPSGRIHGHGWLWIENPVAFVLFDIPTLLKENTLCIKPIDDPDKWLEYCTKQSHMMYLHDPLCKPYIVRYLPLLSDDMIKTYINDYGDYIKDGESSGA